MRAEPFPMTFSITGLKMISHPNGKEMKYQLSPGLHFWVSHAISNFHSEGRQIAFITESQPRHPCHPSSSLCQDNPKSFLKNNFFFRRKNMRKGIYLFIFLLFCVLFYFTDMYGESDERFDEDLLKVFSYRSIGPSRQGGRIVDIAVDSSSAYTFYVATASGGLWKTTNNGTTFTPIFDHQSVISIGDVAVSPSNPDIVWVGTGEANNSRSCYWGDGVYKSGDGGKTWKNMGLKESHHVGRIIIHPQNPDIVYAAALGHLYSFNEERGLYKTIDGGKTWDKVLYINDQVGVVDVALDPSDPDTLYAASYQKQRLPWHFEEGGPGSAIYKTTDGGKTWTKLEGGLPTGKIGRIGVDVYLKNPDIVCATIENANERPPTEEEKKQDEERGVEPQKRPVGGEVYRSQDGGKTWQKMNSIKDDIGGHPGYYYGQIRIDPNDDQVIYVPSIILYRSTDGGKTWGRQRPENAGRGTHSDHHALWIDPQNSNHMILGNDGGLCITYDRGKSWDFYDNLPLAQCYAVGMDMDDPYHVYTGLQDNGSWKGPSNSLGTQITLDDWESVGGGDGFYNQADPHESRWLYNESQFGYIQRVDQKTGEVKMVRPSREKEKPPLRFNWSSPILISPHNSQIIYLGGDVLFRSLNRGDDWQEVSPDLTLNDPVKIAGKGNIQYCTITTISESPLIPGIIWVGTDDGKIHLSKNNGGSWTELTENIVKAGAPEEYWVSRVFASPHQEGTAYVSKTGYRRDDFRPFLYKTTDYGNTWTSISGNLPDEPVNVIFEDLKNPNLLFLGTEMAVYVSIDSGKRWVRMRNNMPTNAVHDLLIHPRENDLVVGTHGRGIFITDISPLQEIDEKVIAQDICLFEIEPQKQRIIRRGGSLLGHRHFTAPNEPDGVVIYYYLKNKASEDVSLIITDPYGEEVNRLKGEGKEGINKLVWNMRHKPSKEELEQRRSSPFRYRGPAGKLASPGEYVVILQVGEKRLTRKAMIR